MKVERRRRDQPSTSRRRSSIRRTTASSSSSRWRTGRRRTGTRSPRRCARAHEARAKFANYWFERGYALEQQARRRTDALGGGEGAVPEVHRGRSRTTPTATTSSATCSSGPTTSRRRSRTTRRRSSTKPDELGYYAPLADLYLRLGYVNEAEQVAEGGRCTLRRRGATRPSSACTSLLGEVYQEQEAHARARSPSSRPPRRPCGDCTEPASRSRSSTSARAYALLNPPRKSEAIAACSRASAGALQGRRGGELRRRVRRKRRTLVSKLEAARVQ